MRRILRIRSLAGTGLALVAAVGIAACGSSSSSSSSNSSSKSGGGSSSKASNVKLAAPSDSPSGDVTLCIGKDTSGLQSTLVHDFNAKYPNAKAKLLELPESADDQRTQLTQRLRGKSSECDVLGLDVVWTAEFAAQGWLADATKVVDARKDEFIPSTLETAKYQGNYWAVPYNSNAGFIYYRTDQVKTPPTSWEDLYKQAKAGNGIAYQGAAYEGLTVNFLELLYSDGGDVLNKDGTKSAVDSPQARQVLKFMVDGIKDGSAPKAVTTYMEEETRRAFESGKVTFARNWPYAYTLGKKSPVAATFDIAPFPGFAGHPAAGVIGGYNLAVSAYSKHRDAAATLIDYMTSPPAQLAAAKTSSPPVLTASYDDPAVTKAMPFAATLRTAIQQAKARPVSPVYPQISEAISRNVNKALSGSSSVDKAITDMNSQIDKALATF